MARPVKGFTTRPPVATPRLSNGPVVDMRSISLRPATEVRKASMSALLSSVVNSSTRGCSGEMTANVMPKEVSGRVVNTFSGSTSLRALPSSSATARPNSVPSERPIQWRCMTLTFSGQSTVSMSSSSCWA